MTPRAIGPRDEGRPPPGRERRAGRVLVDGRDHDGVRGGRGEPVHASPSSSTGIAIQRRPAASIVARYSGSDGSSTATTRAPPAARTRIVRPRPWAKPFEITILEGSAAVPRTRLRYVARAARSSGTPCPPPYVSRSAGAVARTRRSDRSQAAPRELADIRPAGPEIERVGPRLRGRRPGRGRGGRRRDPGGTAGPADDVSLRDELLIRLHDDAAGDTKLRRERSARRQDAAGLEPPVTDRVAQPALQLTMQGLSAVRVQRDEQLQARTGLRSWHRTGP